ncbi:prolyl aminopeptidase [Actinokineospora auranticolor]|uniref:Proline iminopeptidase n=1 Tax=Actinokineospora auranticolor TaxID=155976 RepID=A0A2S6GEF1_9PSEU|nr:prolyl aminopeptidase [Actinokineospora auranticolor]PPK63617.1 proline iminopeptidase [Actinokineospora auranticolor]
MTYDHGEPHDQGLLDVGQGNRVHWEVSGNPDGLPALLVHGGPGAGSNPRSREFFDPDRYRLVSFDQRGCGRSEPHAADPDTDMRHNTTHHLIADVELLREHLGIDRWLVAGGSWGSTLALAYAERNPHRVRAMVLSGATNARRADFEWITGGVGRFFPEALARFRAGAPDLAPDDTNVAAAYSRLMEDPDQAVRDKAIRDWTTWEDTVVSLEPNGDPQAYSGRPPRNLAAMVRTVTHYWGNHAWLEEDEILRDAHKLRGIPGTILHGRHDLGGPVSVAWELVHAWPDAELVVVEDSGHTGSAEFFRRKREILDRYAELSPR